MQCGSMLSLQTALVLLLMDDVSVRCWMCVHDCTDERSEVEEEVTLIVPWLFNVAPPSYKPAVVKMIPAKIMIFPSASDLILILC